MGIKQFEIIKSFKTTQYNRFKSMPENRDVKAARLSKIERSVLDVGWIPSRIVVNEKLEVIDGQGRLEVAKKHGLPVYCDMIKDIGAKECRAMNAYQTNWNNVDYINSYANAGNQSYRYIQALYKQFGDLGLGTVLMAAGIKSGSHSAKEDPLRRGELVVGEEAYNRAVKKLDYIKPFRDVLKAAGGRTECYCYAVFFAYDIPEVNPTELKERITKYQSMLPEIANYSQAVKALDDVYNYRRPRVKKVYIAHEYEKRRA